MDRVQFLRETLQLQPHPEGGHYRETWRSPGPGRSPLTLIYFLLAAGECSRWHRVDADEVWLLHEGALELWIAPVEGGLPTQTVLQVASGQVHAVVPKGHWQAARAVGTHALVSCAVAPGFEFAGFEMLRRDSTVAKNMIAACAETTAFF
jgi:predicted cupin superfamily sugar epimerase